MNLLGSRAGGVATATCASIAPGTSELFAALDAPAPLRTAEVRIPTLPPVVIAAPDPAVRTARHPCLGQRFGPGGGLPTARRVAASDESKCEPQRSRVERKQKQLQEQERQKDAALDAAAEGEFETLEHAVGPRFEWREQQDQQQIGDDQPLQHVLPANSGAGRLLRCALQQEPGEHRVDERGEDFQIQQAAVEGGGYGRVECRVEGIEARRAHAPQALAVERRGKKLPGPGMQIGPPNPVLESIQSCLKTK